MENSIKEVLNRLSHYYEEYKRISPVFYKKKNTPRELFKKAYDLEYSHKERYDSLGQLYAITTTNPYNSIHPAEKEIIDALVAEIKESFPTVAKEWLTPKDLEEEFGIKQKTQEKMRMASHPSDIPFSKVGKFVYYERAQINQWLKANQMQGLEYTNK